MKGRISKKKILFAFILAAVSLLGINEFFRVAVSANDERKSAIENALYAKAEFFDAETVVPFPTAEARKRLANVAEDYPNDAEIIRKLAELDEKLAHFDSAEQKLQKLLASGQNDLAAYENLAAFYERRGQFEKSAEITEKTLAVAAEENRVEIFGRLIEFARIHGLEKYQNAEFYRKIAAQNPSALTVIEGVIESLNEQEKYAEALKILRESKQQFPEAVEKLLVWEVDLLVEMNQPKEAEKVFSDSFDYFWTQETKEKFYELLDSENRLRAYGRELKDAFKRDPKDFQTAVRLIQYQQNDGEYENDSAFETIEKLESERAAAKIEWSADELAAAAQILLAEGNSDAASRYFYTLSLAGGLAPKSELRRQVLYRLFTIFSNAETEKLALAKGDLQFYKDVATADVNPGITTGILSLIFADAQPQKRLEEKEITAARLFNRAAAYRIFLEFKENYVDAPETAQMYLDIVRFYAAEKETEIAETTLAEFEQKYESSADYADAALKLADAYITLNKREKEREICRKLLDFLGKQKRFSETNTIGRTRKNLKFGFSESQEINYETILKRLVETLARENKTAEILALYSDEIQKYPDREMLYEKRLIWLEQTNLAEEELKVYRQAIEKFPTRSWQDKLARWFVRRNRKQEFAEFSTDLIEKLNDAQTEKYLTEFSAKGVDANDFDAQIYLKLHLRAHERFPHNLLFINGLLDFYRKHDQYAEWRKLAAKHYFEFREVREIFVQYLASRGELRTFLETARGKVSNEEITLEKMPYALFRADAAAHLAGFEESVGAYRQLNELYPNTPEYAERLINFTRSFGQKNRETLLESARLSETQAENSPSVVIYRTRSGELNAELGDYQKADSEWRKLPATAAGTDEIYLETATVEWDYFQYDAALRTIADLRERRNNERLYAFQTGAILEAKGETANAVGEYFKAFGADGEEDFSDGERAVRRLISLSKREGVAALADAAFKREKARRKESLSLALAYAEVLRKNGRGEQAQTILKNSIPASGDENALNNAAELLTNKGDFAGVRLALGRLAETAENPKDAIKYRLRLAENLAENNQRVDAKNALSALLAKFPNNYGALKQSSEILWRINLRGDAISVLQTGVLRGKGEYKYIFSCKLAARLVTENRLPEAEKVLFDLHETDKTNTEVFRELASIYVRTGNAEKMRVRFAETVKAITAQDIETEVKRLQVAEFRRRMIEAFTELKDYRAAVEQYIEIINRDADDETNVQAAIDYVKRYGGADILLDYYQKTAAESYKNYRWNLVLAQLYEANGDAENAAQNYRTAILNQPEIPELYAALAELELKRKNYDAALENINRVLELTNEEPRFIVRKIEILEKAGRSAEAAAERAKLPVEQRPKLTVSEQFAAARNSADAEKASENYRQAFDAQLANPFLHELKSADISGYVQALRGEENLNQIAEKLWLLREKLTEESEKENSLNAGKARSQLKILDAAMPEAIGNAAKTHASSEENSDLQKDLARRIDENFGASDRRETLVLLQNIAHRAGFGTLEENLLLKNLEAGRGGENHFANLKSLVNFYEERGMFRRAGEILGNEKSNFSGSREFLIQLAANAKNMGDTPKEIAALREIYQNANGKLNAAPDENFGRYLEILYRNGDAGRTEIAGLCEKSSPFQLQLINFLLVKGENFLAHRAIENAELTKSWKRARNAETSLALKEYGAENECYFCDALRIAPIGDLILQKTDEGNYLKGDEWFRLSRQYGEWLADAPTAEMRADTKSYATAMTENLPRSADEQAKLGAFYLDRNDAKSALEHFWLAAEIDPENANVRANLGTVYFKMGDRKKAFEIWDETLKSENIKTKDLEFYFRTLQKNGLESEAREKIFAHIVRDLERFDYYSSGDGDDETVMRSLIRAIAASFADENAKLVYFKRICAILDRNSFLPEMLLGENLLEKKNHAPFYQMLIARSLTDKYERDYDFEAALEKSGNANEAEEILEQENAYKIKEPESEKINWQQKYLMLLIENGQNAEAKNVIANVEDEIARRYARPFWLRLAKLRLSENDSSETLSAAKRLVGIEIKATVPNTNPPDAARLNEVLQMFRQSKRDGGAEKLLTAYYARMLALGKFETANFVGLARLFYEKGDAENGLQLLNIMNAIADDEQRETALAELAALEIIKAQTIKKATETDEIFNQNKSESFRLSAATAAEFGQISAAIAFRQKLLEIAPENAANIIELARLFAKNGGEPEAIQLLAEVLKNRNALRNDRWAAVWVAREIVKDKRILLDAITDADGEIRNAVEILINGQIEIKTESPSPQFWFFVGLTAKSFRQNDFAINAFERSLLNDKNAEIEKIFAEKNALQQLVELHIAENRLHVALKIADTDKTTKSDELLETLSKTAENIGEFERAIEFEKAKSAEKVSPERLKLLEKSAAEKDKKATNFTVDAEKTRRL